jgi:polysaccharide export outer membrane protein
MRSWLLFGIAAAALAGCAGPRFIGRPDLTVVPGTALPAPTLSDTIANVRPVVIGPFDEVAIDVFGVPEMTRNLQVDASGRIAFPLIGALEASGKTPDQLSAMIADRLRARYVRNPRVTVNLTRSVNQSVTVDGSVHTPGIYPIAGRMSLMRAIARAEGVTEFARENYVIIFRRVQNQDMAAVYDLRAIRQGIYPDPEVYASDIVLVGDSQARRLFKDLLQASGVLVTPLIALLNRTGP